MSSTELSFSIVLKPTNVVSMIFLDSIDNRNLFVAINFTSTTSIFWKGYTCILLPMRSIPQVCTFFQLDQELFHGASENIHRLFFLHTKYRCHSEILSISIVDTMKNNWSMIFSWLIMLENELTLIEHTSVIDQE